MRQPNGCKIRPMLGGLLITEFQAELHLAPVQLLDTSPETFRLMSPNCLWLYIYESFTI